MFNKIKKVFVLVMVCTMFVSMTAYAAKPDTEYNAIIEDEEYSCPLGKSLKNSEKYYYKNKCNREE